MKADVCMRAAGEGVSKSSTMRKWLRVDAYWWTKLNLLRSLVRRDLEARYKGSVLGLLWPLMTQVSQLLIYTYVYSVIFKVDPASRGLTDNNPLAVGLWIFSGLLPWWGFSSGLSLSASAVIKQTNLVKKVVFPLALLPPVSVLSAFIESLFGLAALLVAYVLFIGTPHTILILLPLVWIPQLLLTLGLGYLAAALTVFLRDIPQTIRIILNIWFYLTPIVYPVTLIPEPIRVWVFRLNPMAIPVQVSRDLFMKGEFYDWIAWGSTVALTSFLLYIGISVYQKLRPAFADVL